MSCPRNTRYFGDRTLGADTGRAPNTEDNSHWVNLTHLAPVILARNVRHNGANDRLFG